VHVYLIVANYRLNTEKALEKKSGFSRVSRNLSQTPSDLRQELLSTGIHGDKSFQGHWKKSWVQKSELYLFVFLAAAVLLLLLLFFFKPSVV